MRDINGSHTCTKKKFRVDANKECDWDASVAIKPNQNFTPTAIADWLYNLI